MNKRFFITKVDRYVPVLFGLDHAEKKMVMVEFFNNNWNSLYLEEKFKMEYTFQNELTKYNYKRSNSYILGKGLGLNSWNYDLKFIICYNPNGSIAKEDYVILCSNAMQNSDITKLKKEMNLDGMSSRKNFLLRDQDLINKFVSTLPLEMEDYLPEKQLEMSSAFIQEERKQLGVIPEEELKSIEWEGDEEITEDSLYEHIDNILEEVEEEVEELPFN